MVYSWFPRSPGRPDVWSTARGGREPVPHSVVAYQCARSWNVRRSARIPRPWLGRGRRLLDHQEELGVALGALHPVHEQLERLLRVERVQYAPQLPDDLE